ncbi:hypothetical protein [Segniliparus rugosus]|uniref:hypothetical protein n=1 Tax=Segniliparus rugosus TaxID=286804 RepID=UPI0001F03F72|nr:hypothetical protein [Segniliparus rugosus]
MHHYQIDLRGLFSEEAPLSPRYVLTLIEWLPIGSNYEAECRGGSQFRGWDESRYALVATVNALRALQYLYLRAHLDPKKSAKPKPPEPFPAPEVPEDRARPRKGSFAFVAAARLAATRKRKTGD